MKPNGGQIGGQTLAELSKQLLGAWLHLRSRLVSILLRYPGRWGFNAQTTAVLDQWPLLTHWGGYRVR
jgi:hypothetical protein